MLGQPDCVDDEGFVGEAVGGGDLSIGDPSICGPARPRSTTTTAPSENKSETAPGAAAAAAVASGVAGVVVVGRCLHFLYPIFRFLGRGVMVVNNNNNNFKYKIKMRAV